MIAQSAAALVAAARSGAPVLYAQTAARMLAVHLLTHHSRFGKSVDDRGVGYLSERRIARVVDYMSANLEQPVSLDRLAAEAGISKFHFARLFRERTGYSPTRLLTRLRLESARRQLQSADIGIGLIAERCGYPNAGSFSTAYRREFGMSPRQAKQAASIADD